MEIVHHWKAHKIFFASVSNLAVIKYQAKNDLNIGRELSLLKQTV